jgi:hypothetical protein
MPSLILWKHLRNIQVMYAFFYKQHELIPGHACQSALLLSCNRQLS